MTLPFRWGQPLRLPRREEDVGGRHQSLDIVPALPSVLEGKPFPVWGSVPDPSTSDSIVAAHQISQFRWVKVGVSLLVGERVVVPLLDTDNVPYVDPSIPPFVIAMRDEGGPIIGDAAYDAPRKGTWRQGCIRSTRDIDRVAMVHWFIRRKNDPVPHWQLEVHHGYHDTTGDVPSTRVATLDLNFLTTGVGPPAAHKRIWNPAPNTNNGAAGIWNLWDPASDHDHGDSPDKAGLECMTMAVAAHDTSGSVTNIYWTTTGLAAGTPLFKDDTIFTSGSDIRNPRPAVFIYGDPKHDQFAGGSAELRATLATTSWRPGTHGCGYPSGLWSNPYPLDNGQSITFPPAGTSPEDEREFFYDHVCLDWDSNRFRTRVFRGAGVPSGTNRTFYVTAIGRTYGT